MKEMTKHIGKKVEKVTCSMQLAKRKQLLEKKEKYKTKQQMKLYITYMKRRN